MSEQEAEEPASSSPLPDGEGQKKRSGYRRGRGGRARDFSQQERRPEASLNTEELRELFELVTAHGLTDFELEREGFRVRLRKDLAPQISAPDASHTPHATQLASHAPAVGTPTPVTASAQPEQAAEEELFIITAPIVGTFYRSPSPTAEVFVQPGSKVEPTTVVCIIEAMKLMNEIQAETSGEVVKIYVENNQPVEYGQKLFGIRK